ncbi:HTTM domain-containing protein [Chitinophaga sp. sic0106]|uniref:HTTM domain-containing protein n=1 Tax=Chitinophaga sp. sic0106 TaxID=2854785 RepID=UPI001C43AC65|nr:HTTM domain-containing protein [Chitinophaga sp. sic0106]MBV7530879.1 HTTM domain-containing protein [Chitinophaga sp. sic0106]
MTATKAHPWLRPVSIAPLVTFRIIFGLLMFGSLLRFVLRGWIDTLYIQPAYHFTYWGFEWVQPLGATGMYILFGMILLSTLLITLGLFYRLATIVFFLGFTYVELIDVTTYLNHYYFISLVAFILIWLPANRRYAVDTLLWPFLRRDKVPAWTIGILRFQLAIVYVYAGLAKINSDWLLQAEPMKTWLPARSHLPLVGPLMYKPWVAYVFSWFGCLYDCFIVFFLLNRRTRPWAYAVVVGFHVATAIFFPGIGMFPYVMIAATLIFFSGDFHERLLPGYKNAGTNGKAYTFSYPRVMQTVVVLYMIIQLLLPLRFLLYPDRLFWNEEGYRFSWRVMLMEKAGTAYFTVKEAGHQRATTINNAAYLTPLQEKMMSTQPDMILKYAHYLRQDFTKKGWKSPEVYAEIYVALNGQRSRLFIDSSTNLAAQPLSWRHYKWILPYK